MNKFHLTLSELVKEMWSILQRYDHLTNRDSLYDIAKYLIAADLNTESELSMQSFYWGLGETGAEMNTQNDFGDWEKHIGERYKLTRVPRKGWNIVNITD